MKNSKILHNAEWILVCKVIQSLLQFVVGVLTARYLGPANYGLVNYAASVVAFFMPLMELGLRNTLVQEYVNSPEREGKIMGTCLMLNSISAVACIAGVTLFASVANAGDPLAIWVCALYSVTLLSQAFELLQYWFQAKLLSKYSSLAMLFAYVIVSSYKIYLLIAGKSVQWFALSHAVEYGVAGAFLLSAYARNGQQRLCFSWSLAKELLSKSRYYIVASLLVVVYGRIASLILMHQYGEVETGYFAAASTCTCITGFVFSAIIDTARPVVLGSLERSQEAFEQNVSRLYSITIWLAVAQGIGFTLLGGLIVRMLYGEAYMPAAPVLRILIWSSLFSYLGVVRNIWILGAEKHRFLWIINLGGSIASLLANLLLIPVLGACGAALATIITQVFANVIMGYILKDIRTNNRLMLKALDIRVLISTGIKCLNGIRRRDV